MAEPVAVNTADCPLQNTELAGTILIVGCGPLLIEIELLDEPQIFVSVTKYIPDVETVTVEVLTVVVLHANVPVPAAVKVTEPPGQIVFADDAKLSAVDGPALIVTDRIAVPQELVKVAV